MNNLENFINKRLSKRHKEGNENDFAKSFEAAHDEFSSLADQVQMKLSGMDQKQWNTYCTNVEANFKLVGEKIAIANEKFHEEAKDGNYKKAAQHMFKTLQACMKGLQVALVDSAESLGITNILRKIGVVENTPKDIMKNLHNSIDKIYPSLETKAVDVAKGIAAKVEKFADKAASKGEKLFNKATDWMER